MVSKKCPDCGSKSFYVKDPDDQYTLFEFNWEEGKIIQTNPEESETIDVVDETETYCDTCAWHDKFKTLT